ncbi:ectoine synthase [Magnetococcales bacterium HHB-1]
MIVRHLDKIVGSAREVHAETGTWVSRRLLLRDDNMGFSLHDTTIFAGTETRIWYKHHLEAVYCVAGEGEIEEVETGIIHPISEGAIYALDKHECHNLRAHTDMRMICVFNPALTGREDHDADGVYPLIEEG